MNLIEYKEMIAKRFEERGYKRIGDITSQITLTKEEDISFDEWGYRNGEIEVLLEEVHKHNSAEQNTSIEIVLLLKTSKYSLSRVSREKLKITNKDKKITSVLDQIEADYQAVKLDRSYRRRAK